MGKDFTIEEMVAIRRAFEPQLKKEAEKRQRAVCPTPHIRMGCRPRRRQQYSATAQCYRYFSLFSARLFSFQQ